jgi:predicted dehydrogenase
MVYLRGSKIKAACMNALGENPAEITDNASILVKMVNGSTGVVNYFANGSKSYAKERLEVFSQEKTVIMDNFIKTSGYGTKGFTKLKTKLDKGHKAQFGSILEKIKSIANIEM